MMVELMNHQLKVVKSLSNNADIKCITAVSYGNATSVNHSFVCRSDKIKPVVMQHAFCADTADYTRLRQCLDTNKKHN